MKQDSVKGDITVLGIDLAKNSFQLHGVDAAGQRVVRKPLSRHKVSAYVAQLPPCLIGMEACGGAHHWVRVFTAFGHTVRLMAPQFVKPYVKSNKNDAVDAEAICEAVQRPNMRFVPEKSIEQQDIQSLHRIRSQLIARRTAQSNQIRGLLLEYGIVIPQGIRYVRQPLPLILEAADNGLSDLFRELLYELYEELVHLDERVAAMEHKLHRLSAQDERCQRLLSIPGIGILSATALVAAPSGMSVPSSQGANGLPG
jgi:transposase